jgi:hypothetical protein
MTPVFENERRSQPLAIDGGINFTVLSSAFHSCITRVANCSKFFLGASGPTVGNFMLVVGGTPVIGSTLQVSELRRLRGFAIRKVDCVSEPSVEISNHWKWLSSTNVEMCTRRYDTDIWENEGSRKLEAAGPNSVQTSGFSNKLS